MNWQTIVYPLIASGLVALIGFIIRFFVEKSRAINNATIQMLAGTAVHYAETHFGPDTAKGQEKEALAIRFLSERIKGLDKETAEKFVKSAYSAIFTNLAPLGQGAATPSITPSV